MGLEMVISIVGGFLILMLSVNGYFLRGIFKDLNDVKIQLAVSIESSSNKERRITVLEGEVRDIMLKLGHKQ